MLTFDVYQMYTILTVMDMDTNRIHTAHHVPSPNLLDQLEC